MVQELTDRKAVAWSPPSESSTVANENDHSIKKHDHSSKHNGDRVKSKRGIGEYNFTSTLGSGGMGKVKLAVHQNDSHKKVIIHLLFLYDHSFISIYILDI